MSKFSSCAATGTSSATFLSGSHCLHGRFVSDSSSSRTWLPWSCTYKSPSLTGACPPRISDLMSLSLNDKCEPPWTSTAHRGWTGSTAVYSSRPSTISFLVCRATTSAGARSSSVNFPPRLVSSTTATALLRATRSSLVAWSRSRRWSRSWSNARTTWLRLVRADCISTRRRGI